MDALENGQITTTPVKTQFGYHVIEVKEFRKRPPESYEAAKGFLEGQLRRKLFDEILPAVN